MSPQNQKSTRKPHAPDLAGAMAAMRRAAKRARRRASETTGFVAVFKDGKIVQEKVGTGKSG